MLGENRARKGERRVGEAGYMIGQGFAVSIRAMLHGGMPAQWCGSGPRSESVL